MKDKLLDNVLDQMWDEVIGAKHYYDLYETFKSHNQQMAKVFLDIAPIELTHFDKLVTSYDSYIDTIKETEKDLKVIWEHEKSRLTKFAREIRNEISNARY